MAILITGALGFLGVNLVKRFSEMEEGVVCLDVGSPDNVVEKYWGSSGKHVVFYQGDILDMEFLFRVARGHEINTIIHAASITATHPDVERKDFAAVVRTNVIGTVNMLLLSHSVAPGKFIYVSSASVYGFRDDPKVSLEEDCVLRPRTVYPITKFASELLCKRDSQIYNSNLVILRLSSLYGPMERKTSSRQVLSLIYDYVKDAMEGRKLCLSSLEWERDYTYIDDVTEAFVRVFRSGPLPNIVYNVSIGASFRTAEVIRVLRRHIPDLQYSVIEEKTSTHFREDIRRGPLDISRAKKDFGFNPAFSLESGITNYLRWFKEFEPARMV